jgi:acetolactate synthase-1/2/3 large subunit
MTSSDLDSLRMASEWLQTAERPVCLAGRGAVWSGAADELLALSARLPSLRIASTPNAKGVFSERHARALGVFGFGGHARARTAVSESDVLLVVGSRLLEPSSAGWHARFGQGRTIHVDVDPVRALGGASREHLGLVGDARNVLSALLANMNGRSSFESSGNLLTRAIPRLDGVSRSGAKVKPQLVFEALSEAAEHVPICADAGHSMCWAIEWLERTRPGDFQISVDWGTMGFALPAAIGVSLARGATPAIAVTGDGAMAMAGGDLHTAVEARLPVVLIVLNDACSGMVKAGATASFGAGSVPDPSYRTLIDFTAYASAFGARTELVTRADTLAEQIRGALSRPGPTVLDVRVDEREIPKAVIERAHGLGAFDDESPSREGAGS